MLYIVLIDHSMGGGERGRREGKGGQGTEIKKEGERGRTGRGGSYIRHAIYCTNR